MEQGAGTVFLAEDEHNLREALVWALEREGWKIHAHGSGTACLDDWLAWRRVDPTRPHALVLDIGLPGMDGLELCRRIRREDPRPPVIFATSRDEEIDRILGLELGADDYVCKPYSIRELMVRLRVLCRRAWKGVDPAPVETPPLEAGDLVIHPDQWRVLWQGREVSLSITEFRILHHLALHAGAVKTREQLQAAAYVEETWVGERTMDSHIRRIRKKLDIDAQGGPLETVHGFGYRWVRP